MKGHKLYLPLVEGQLSAETARKKILETLQEAKFNKTRLETATMMLKHLEQFLAQKGHKVMCLQVKRTLESLEDRRAEKIP